MLLFPLFDQSLNSANLWRAQMFAGLCGIFFRTSQTKPKICLYIILRNPAPFHVEESQLTSSFACGSEVWNMLCSSSIPFGCQLEILFDALAIFVPVSQFNLCNGITTFGCLLVPLYCFL
jgi:hypothetical protein